MGINRASAPAPDDNGRVAAAAPPAGVQSDFDSPDWTGGNIVEANIVALTASAIFLGLRLYTRTCLVRQPGWDDVFILLAWLLSLALGITTCITATQYGLGSHMWDVELSQYSPHFLKLNAVALVLYSLANMFIKCSILYFLIRVSARRSAFTRCYLWSLLALSVLYNIACIFGILFSCDPVAALWDIALMAEAHCADQHSIYTAVAGINVATDILVLVSPLLLFIGVKLPARQKIAVIGILTVGGLACVFSIIRLVAISGHEHNGDDTRLLVATVCWSIAEIGSGCVCSCAACLKPFFRRHFKWFASSSERAKLEPGSNVLSSLSTPNRETQRLRPDDVGPNDINASTSAEHSPRRSETAQHCPHHLLPGTAPTGSSQEDLISTTAGAGRRDRIVITVTSDFGVVENRVPTPTASNARPKKRW